MIFDAHDDIWAHVAQKRYFENEKDIFRRYHYQNFLEGNVKAANFVFWLRSVEGKTFPEIHEITAKAMLDEIEDAKDILNIVKEYDDFDFNSKKINVLVSFEGLNQIGEDIDLLNEYYDKYFLRAASLTWNEVNDLATPHNQPNDRGLTDIGKLAVRRLEDLGVLLDVSHCNEKTFFDLASMVEKPFIASHSNARAIADHTRNLTDEQIKEIAKSGGFIGMNAYYAFVDLNKKPIETSIDDLIRHLDHIANLVGVEHLACGFDYMYYFESDKYEDFDFENSTNSGLKGLGYEAESKNFLTALKKAGFNDEEVAKVGYKNVLRVYKEVLK